MTGHDDFDRTLVGWFEADARSPAPADGLERVLDATRRRRPRPAWLAGPGSRWVGQAPDAGSSSGARAVPRLGLRWSTVLILLLAILALVGGAILVGARLFPPSPLPTGRLGHLAYGLDGDIYVADWDGRNPTRISHAPPDGSTDCHGFGGEGPIWSPDGRHLAYRSGGAFCPGATVLISDPAGHVVASFPGTGWLVSWSPDSTRVATSVDLGHTFGIYGLDSVRQALLTVPLGYEVHGDYDPVWSPDGLSLLMPIAPVTPPSPSEIWELPIDGGTPRRVPSEDPPSHRDAAYSSDGARVAFIAYPDSSSLVIAKADGTELRVLVGAKNDPNYGPGLGAVYQKPVVSPTGDRVAFMWSPAFYDQTSDPSLSTYELRVVDVASGTVTTLASGSGVDHLGVIRFSPGGDRILFSRSDANYVGTSLWSVNVDGSDAQLLVTGTGWGDWQPLPAGP
jgi:Tol biopolymer transport system component